MNLVTATLVLVGLAVAAIVGQRFGLVDLRGHGRRGGGSGVWGIGDEVFHPTRYEAAQALDRESSLPTPAPVPGDGDLGVYDGRVVIDLRARADRAA